MELKSGELIDATKASVCFNRTFMELKWQLPLWARMEMHSFNRTFMELKYPSDAQKESGNYSFNRTFMELKW